MFSNFCFIRRQLYSLFIIIVRALRAFSFAFSCFSFFFYLMFRLSYYTFVENVCSPKHTVFYCFIGLCFLKRVSDFNYKLIYNEINRNA